MTTTDPFDDPAGYVPPPPAAPALPAPRPMSKLEQADAARTGHIRGSLSRRPYNAAQLEACFVEFARLRPNQPERLARIRKLAPEDASALFRVWFLSQNWKGWRGHDEDCPTDLTGLRQETLEGIEPDLDSKGERRVCMLCGGTRWLRMTNHGPDPVEIETEFRGKTRIYEAGSDYLIPCGHCSSGRKDRITASRKRAHAAAGRRRSDRTFEEGL